MWRWLLVVLVLVAAFFVGMTMSHAQSAPEFWNHPRIQACCSDADAVYADDWRTNADGSVTARVTGGGPRDHDWAPIGKEYHIPANRVVDVPGNPTGRPLLFIAPISGFLYCFAMGPMT